MRRAAPVMATVAALALTGCGSDPGASGPPTYHPTKSPSPQHSASVNPAVAKLPTATPSAPAGQRPTMSSAKRFARYAFDVVELAYSRRDMKPVLALVADRSRCSKCTSDIKVVRRQAREGYYQVPHHQPHPARVYPMGDQGAVKTVGISFTMPAGTTIDDQTGQVRHRLPAAPRSYFEAILHWHGGRWRLQNYSVQYGG